MSASNLDGIRYARRVALMVKPDQIDNFLAKMRSDIIPNLKSQAGIRRMYLLRTPGANDFVSLTFWDNRSYADTYGASDSFRNNTESIRDMLESEPSVTQFDVDLHDVNAEDLPAPKTAVKKVSSTTTRRTSRKPKKKTTKKKRRKS
jgi:heme-degrading monooxygenase HmoA